MKNRNKLETMPENWEGALAMVAHPDDLEYGASSAIARWTSQGKQIAYLLVTRGEAGIDAMTPEETGCVREYEEQESARVVGVDTVEFLGYQDGVIEYGLQLRRDLARVIRRKRPDVLITINHRLTFGRNLFNMADHRWVGLAVLDAARDAGNRWIFPELLKEGLEPWPNIKMVLVGGSPYPTHAVDVTSFINQGIAALEKQRIYLDNLTSGFSPADFLLENAARTGQQFGCKYAVSFEVILI